MNYLEQQYWDEKIAQQAVDAYNKKIYQEAIMQEPYIKEMYSRFSLLKPSLIIDGNQWCCLYGADLQSGIAGFGDSPELAIQDWSREMLKPLRGSK